MNILEEQGKHHLEDCLNELKWGRPAWAQKLIHTWQNEVIQKRLLTGQDDTFNDIVDKVFEKAEPHEIDKLFKCDFCAYEWTAVYPTGTKELECPQCHNFTDIEHD